MADSDRSAGIYDWLWLVAIGVAGAAIIVTASERTGGTVDEWFYLEAGLQRWRSGSTGRLMDNGTMPLPVDVQTLPLYLIERSRGREWELRPEYHEAVSIARRGTLVFWVLSLLYGWRIARSIGGS